MTAERITLDAYHSHDIGLSVRGLHELIHAADLYVLVREPTKQTEQKMIARISTPRIAVTSGKDGQV